MSAKDVKIFKLKARGDHGAGKTELLFAFGRIARSFGMITALSADGHDMLITATRAQRCALYEFNRSQACSPDGALAKSGAAVPHCASLYAGYEAGREEGTPA